MQVYKQKVKHLLYEHQNNIANLKVDNEVAMKLQADESAQNESVLRCVVIRYCVKRPSTSTSTRSLALVRAQQGSSRTQSRAERGRARA